MKDNFEIERNENITKMGENKELELISNNWIENVSRYKYSYNFDWLGRPIIQFPQDIIAMQEIIWKVKPDLIIETGIARGGSLIFYASMLEILGNSGKVIGIDIDLREQNRIEIEKHSMFKRIILLEGSSTEESIITKVHSFAKDYNNILVCLDSNHTHDHVLKELQTYSIFVHKGSYLVVFDTIIEDLPKDYFQDRNWEKGNNPKTAINEFLKTNNRFIVDKKIQNKLLITTARNGYLKCIKD